MSNDEVFFLCLLTGAKEIIGIKNPIDGLSEEEAKEKWHEVSKSLYDKKMIYSNDNGDIQINDMYAKISAAISFPNIVFSYTTEEGTENCIYIKGQIYLRLERGEECEIKIYEDRNEFIAFLNQVFMFSSCENDISMEITTENMDKSLELFMEENIEGAVEIFEKAEIDKDVANVVLDVFVNNTTSKCFMGHKRNKEIPSQVILKTVKTEEGTWIFKILDNNMKICKYNIEKSLAEVMNF